MYDEWMGLRKRLLFRALPDQFGAEMAAIRDGWINDFRSATEHRRKQLIAIAKELTIDIKSYLSAWHLLKRGGPLTKAVLDQDFNDNMMLLKKWGASDEILYIENEVDSLEKSSLIRLSEMSDEGRINTRWGNDYATGLTHALRRGAVLVTTNPPLINIARKSHPEVWDPVRDKLKAEHPDYDTEQLCSLMTMHVVLANCREIRPIYETTGGEYGYVSLQVNPKNYTDANSMALEAETLYVQLKDQLEGTPNVVFKVPATKAGLEVVRRLTIQGIGVNVTVNFAVAQEMAFGDIIEKGKAKVSFLTLMSGRLDDPIKNELISLGAEDAAEVAKWGGIAVARRVYDILYRQKKYKKSFLLQASLRGPWHIDELVTDEEKRIFITVFPDIAGEYDSLPRDIRPRMKDNVPTDVLEKLNRSNIFRQAYQVDGLEVEEFDNYLPVDVTLQAFGKAYDEFLEYLR
ncbi:MAG TPA: transaldolase family protein [Atribacteraceae bacterium]|nr:transaldolase family protein [Atribacteraceae bacterium]